jgi:predicted aldo/keto reductase-like oxidoreductase
VNLKKSNVSRREFLAKSVAGTLLSLNALPGLGNRRPASEDKQPAADRPILVRTLGKTGLVLPIVNMGVMNADIPMLVQRAFESGMRLFDTAAVYERGRNEEMVGSVLQDMGVRDQAVIATKVWLNGGQRRLPPDRIKDIFLQIADQSLKRLQTGYVDILYCHNVADTEYLNNSGMLEALQLFKKQGKTRYIGFSTHINMAECINEAVKMGTFDVILTTFNYSYYSDRSLLSALERAHSAGIGLIAMKTQCNSVDWYMEQVSPELKEFYRGPIMHSALLKWVLSHEFITAAIPGFTNFDQLEEDIVCARSLEFTPDERKFLEDRGVKLAADAACRQCGSCIATCPKGADIPELLRAQMYAFRYGNLLHARDTLAAIPPERGLAACRQCSACMARCVRGGKISRRIDELKYVFV